jgi:hypothetical protein
MTTQDLERIHEELISILENNRKQGGELDDGYEIRSVRTMVYLIDRILLKEKELEDTLLFLAVAAKQAEGGELRLYDDTLQELASAHCSVQQEIDESERCIIIRVIDKEPSE